MQEKMSYLQDEDSYKQLFYHFYPVLLSFCTAILNNKEDAEEVVSEVMLKVWTMGEDLTRVDNLTVYLFKAARNKAYDALRKKKRAIAPVSISSKISLTKTPLSMYTPGPSWRNLFEKRSAHCLRNRNWCSGW